MQLKRRLFRNGLQFYKTSYCQLRCLHQQKEKIRIGCASGFWGDTSVAAPQLVKHGNIDYLVFDYLSEITMSLLARVKQKNPAFGYCPDFVHFSMAPLIKDIKNKGIKVISNAGGINPLSCAEALKKICEKEGIAMNIAVVTGDDLMPQIDEIKMNSGESLPKTLHTMNAYLGAGPIKRALEIGADVVITGRCVDSAVTLAPLLHEFKWKENNFDLMAAGSLAGHLIECGAQVTGGIFTDWEVVPEWENIGFPIVECFNDGSFYVTKPKNTGGLISTATVAEQMVYEIGDPDNYHLPDVTCSFSNVKLENGSSDGAPQVFVNGAKGKSPSDMYKVSATYMDGYRVTAVCPVIGPFAANKGKRVAESIIKRCQMIFKQLKLNDFKRINIEVLGTEGNYGDRGTGMNTREGVLWFAVEHDQKTALEIFAREIAPAGTGMAPGLTTIVGGRPSVAPVLKLHSMMVPKNTVKIDIHMNGEYMETYKEEISNNDVTDVCSEETKTELPLPRRPLIKGSCTFPLGSLAYTRSGDKGNNANIGVVCRNPAYYPYLKDALTAEKVERYFEHYFDSKSSDNKSCKVTRYELPGIFAFNFVLEDVLGGGGVASLRSDPQGKALGQMLLDFKVKNVPDLLPSTAERADSMYHL